VGPNPTGQQKSATLTGFKTKNEAMVDTWAWPGRTERPIELRRTEEEEDREGKKG